MLERSLKKWLLTAVVFFTASILCIGIAGASQPMTIVIGTPAPIVKVGEDILITMTFVNSSKVTFPLTIVSDGREADSKIVVHRENGLDVAKTFYGKQIYHEDPDQTPVFGFGAAVRPVAAGDQLQTTTIVNKVFQMDSPGTYIIEVDRAKPRELGPGFIHSNAIAVTVTP